MGYSNHAIEIRQTDEYQRWFEGLRDRTVRFRIGARIRRVSLGNCGDIKPVGEGVSELRIQFGPGYRVYLAQRGDALIILLAGATSRPSDMTSSGRRSSRGDCEEAHDGEDEDDHPPLGHHAVSGVR